MKSTTFIEEMGIFKVFELKEPQGWFSPASVFFQEILTVCGPNPHFKY